MNHQDETGKSAPGLNSERTIAAKGSTPMAPDAKILVGQGDVAASGEPAHPKELTADEQMALFEKDLKENDWGHQPC